MVQMSTQPRIIYSRKMVGLCNPTSTCMYLYLYINETTEGIPPAFLTQSYFRLCRCVQWDTPLPALAYELSELESTLICETSKHKDV